MWKPKTSEQRQLDRAFRAMDRAIAQAQREAPPVLLHTRVGDLTIGLVYTRCKCGSPECEKAQQILGGRSGA